MGAYERDVADADLCHSRSPETALWEAYAFRARCCHSGQ